jgi:hypothetical protein
MSEMEMKDDVETEEFPDELSDEALDREDERGRACFPIHTRGALSCHAGN